ncbi:cation-translocating P-type ATPase [Rhodopirellula sp. SWK7]|uniref:cation-translocating P-type ATPase n=1 Tax=Rhodopirellula sp. SWK7 TaxID=595460 RepID=UPI0002BD789B|nr:HAD-IC family P-type ATPase [Rhodopirellula sp. SWK7]EMI46496.1 cation-transporting ATPase, E1-E2 family [Rhodopirellula sp. SWK7]
MTSQTVVELPSDPDHEQEVIAPPGGYHADRVDAVVESLQTSLSAGLTDAEVARRRDEYGVNTLHGGQEARWYQVLGRQFTDVLILILIVAAIVSLGVGEVTDAVTIFAIVLLNGALGFVQEWKAERSLAALRNMLAPTCRVIRDGEERTVEAITLVPGDIVRLETGDNVPADLRIAECRNLRIDESALTGESVSVSKHADPVDVTTDLAERTDMAWMGTAATGGHGIGIVVATGGQTEFGRIATMTEAIGRDTTPLQQKLGVLGKQLGLAAVGVSIIVALTGWAMGKPLLEMFLTGVSLAVAVVPEGLPAVVTLTLALGVREMVRRKALLRRLRAAEGLGAATVICTDKTGTLTQNQMTVQRIWMPNDEVDVTGVGYDPAGHFEIDGEKIDHREHDGLRHLLRSSLRCNHAKLTKENGVWQQRGAPTESALVVAAFKAWLDPSDRHRVVEEHSFDSTRKRMTVIEQSGDSLTAHVKGAPEVILSLCSHICDHGQCRELTRDDVARVNQATESMASQGLRTLAIARRDLPNHHSLDADSVENSLTLLGIVGMMDPPRPEVADAIALAGTAGIRVLMITGDSAATAFAIAKRIGLAAEKTLLGSELDAMTDEELARDLKSNVVFARTTPEHKLRIVNVLQSQGHVVGMTGDGVNDAPALKKADIGIAMGKRGTDVAKGASDIVLTDDNFSSIINAVEEGRRQYDNIQKFVRYLLSSNTGEVIAIFANIVIGGPLLFLPVQILWMNLVTDGLTAVALGLEPSERGTMRRPPRSPDEPVLTKSGIAMIAALGTYVGLVSLALFHFYLREGDTHSLIVAQTVAFTGIIVIEKVNVLNFRSLHTPMKSVGFFSNPWVLVAIVLTILMQVAAVYVPLLQSALHTVPLAWQDWALIVAVALPVFLVTEAVKVIASRRETSEVGTTGVESIERSK